MKKIVISLCMVISLFAYSKKMENYTEFQWGTTKEEIISKLGSNYSSGTNENIETIVYQGIEYEGMRFIRISFVLSENKLSFWKGTYSETVYGSYPTGKIEDKIKKQYKNKTNSDGAEITPSGYLSRGVTYDNEELGIYKIEYLYGMKNSWEQTIAVVTTITKGEPRLIPLFRY